MLARLPESRRDEKRSAWGTILSAAVHTIVIAAAVFATAEARLLPPSDADVIHWTNPVPAARTETPAPAAARPRTVKAALPAAIPVTIPPIDVPAPRMDDFPAVSISTEDVVPSGDPSAGQPVESPDVPAGGGAGSPVGALTAGEVDRAVSLARGARQPRYPESLRARGIEGQVVATFVVTENGRVDIQTISFIRSDDPLFQRSVLEALAAMRFVPAEVGGKPVRQLVQMPFVFTLSPKPF